MEIDGERIIRKSKKAPKWIVCGYIVCILAIIWAIYSGYNKQENQLPRSIDFSTDGAIGMAENKYVYFSVEGLSEQIAICEHSEGDSDKERYYIAINNGFMYILDLDLETVELLKSLQDDTCFSNKNEVELNPITIYGVTEKIPKELKQIIIDICNKRSGEENKVTLENFDSYFGRVLLNVKREPTYIRIENIVIIVAAIVIILLLILHVAMKIEKIKSKKYLKENKYEEEFTSQLKEYIEEDHYKHKVLLTKDFLVDVKYGGFSTFKFSDVKWVHIYNTNSYIVPSTSIEVYLRDGKTNFECVEIKGKPTEEFWGIFDKICERVPEDCLKGFTKENVKSFKEYKNQLKKERGNSNGK